MSKKRKDKYGRALRTGESQLKNGAYTYRKTKHGRKIEFYAPTIEALRAKEETLSIEAAQGVDVVAAKDFTINDAYERYCKNRPELRAKSAETYEGLYKCHVKNAIGKWKMKDVHYSDVLAFYIDLLTDKDLSASTVDTIHAILVTMFKNALRDNLIISNPITGASTDAKRKAHKQRNKRHALTEAQQAAFTGYVLNNPRFEHEAPLIVFLLGTGCRIGEAAALTWQDVDFGENKISINKTLVRVSEQWQINPPKTANGNRTIPMFEAVRRVLIEQRKKQLKKGSKPFEIDGWHNFVFTARNGGPVCTTTFNDWVDKAVKAYNKAEAEKAKREHRQPLILPHISAHIFRHTFASRLCQNEKDLKLIQSIMGHASIATTLDIYAEVSDDRKADKFRELEGKLQII